MKFNVGDKVSVLDEDIVGYVVDLNSGYISIESSEGFVLQFQPEELILEKSLPSDAIAAANLKEILREKEQDRKRKNLPKTSRNRTIPPMEVDLHIHKLTDHEQRMTSHEKLTLQLETAKRQLEFAIRKHIQKVVFIHGVGEGVLKMELETLFRRYDTVKFYDADLQKYGFGATEVYIYQNAIS